jgi:hypothetical protein
MSNIETIGNNTNKMMTLVSKDGTIFYIDIETVKQSITIKDMLDSLGDEDDAPIPIPNVEGSTMKKVLTFCDYVRNNAEATQNLENWNNDRTYTVPLPQWFSDFITVEQSIVFEIILAANFLDIQLLLNLGCKYVASLIRNKTPEELRSLFADPAGPAVPAASDAGPA